MISDNPFTCFVPDHLRDHEVARLRVGRETETAGAVAALAGNGHNVLIYGPRGVGKSFLLRLVENELKRHESIVTIRFSLRPKWSLEASDAEKFAHEVLMALCTHSWTHVLRKEYIDLRESLNAPEGQIKLRSKAESAVFRVYRLMMDIENEVRRRAFSEIGASMAIKGSRSEETTCAAKLPDLLPFECLELCEHLLGTVYRPKGLERLILLCDETNILPTFRQKMILDAFFGGFRPHQVQFVFVAGTSAFGGTNSPLPEPTAFETAFELKPFATVEEVLELLSKHAGTASSVLSNYCVEQLFASLGGHPRLVLEVASHAFSIMRARGGDEISPVDIAQAVRNHDERVRQWMDSMSRMDSPKYNT